MTDTAPLFHLFPQLPVELQDEIWRLCLPHRICETDEPHPEAVWLTGDPEIPVPCHLADTTAKNQRAPMIWSVCRASRAIAFETGNYLLPNPSSSHSCCWRDFARASAHLNWTKSYAALEYSLKRHPLQDIAQQALRLSGTGSVMWYLLQGSPYIWPEEPVVPVGETPDMTMRWNAHFGAERAGERHVLRRDLLALRQLPEWLVVMRTVVVHCDLRTAAPTGLFGLLGDARVQVADIADGVKVGALLTLARESEPVTVTVEQDFALPTAAAMTEQLRKVLEELGYEDMQGVVRPAIMFRLCTQMCNHFSRCMVPKERWGPLGRGRGRGRGQAKRWMQQVL